MKLGGHLLNTQRVRKKFTLFPFTIEGETRWLETIYYVEEWYAPNHQWGWYPQEFITKTQYDKKCAEEYRRTFHG